MTAEYSVGVGTAHLAVLEQWLGGAQHHLTRLARARRRPRRSRSRWADGPLPVRGAAGLPRPRPHLPRPRGGPAPHAVGPRRVRRPRDRAEDGRDRVLRTHHPRGVRRARRRLRHLRARHGGARAGRLGAARHRVGQQRAGRQVDPVLRHRGAEAGVAAPAGDGEQAGLLRPDRARHRLGRRQPHLARDAGRRRLGAQRAEAVHHQRHLGRRRAGLRPHQRRRPARRHRLPRPDGHPRLRGARDQGQARTARPGHRRAVPLRRARAGLGRAGRGRARASRSR